MKYWRTFIKETTVHGLRFLIKRTRITRWAWSVIFTFCLTLCLWQSAINTRDYLQFNVKTSSSYRQSGELQFPAISLWNSNLWRRSTIGRRWQTKLLAAKLINLDFNKLHGTCDYDMAGQRDSNDEVIDKFLKTVMDADSASSTDITRQENIDMALKYFFINRDMTFIKCWWQQTEMNCSNIILNVMFHNTTAFLPAFAFNLDPTLVRMVRDKNVVISLQNDDYKEDSNIGTWSDGAGAGSGLSFLLNVHTKEYCMFNQDPWFMGVGIHATFHSPQQLPDEPDSKGTILFQPGYKYDVVLKPTRYSRQIEHLGKCISAYTLYAFQTNVYNRHLCQLQCAYEIIWKHCGCIAVVIQSLVTTFAKHHGLNESRLETCFDKDPTYKCLRENLFEGGTFAFNKYCTHCIQPCDETVYESDVTAVAIPPKRLTNYYKEVLNTTTENMIVKNYLLLNIFFESKSVNFVLETQKYTVRELFIYIGNNAILFLGMSFMSFFEPFVFLLRMIYSIAKEKWSNKKHVPLKKRTTNRKNWSKKGRKIGPTTRIITVQPFTR